MLQKSVKSMLFTLVLCVSAATSKGLATDPALKSGMARNSSTTDHILVMRLERGVATEGSVIGRLYLDGKFECYTLEDSITIIPAGRYKATKFMSSKFKYEVIGIAGVPLRSDIEFHRGNFNSDSHGCILVGISHTDKSVVGSRGALTRLISHFHSPAVLVVQ